MKFESRFVQRSALLLHFSWTVDKQMTMKLLLLPLLLVFQPSTLLIDGASDTDTELLFKQWMVRHTATFNSNSSEYARRLACFSDNLAAAKRQNATAETARLGHTAMFGLSKFSHLCPEEFAAKLGHKQHTAGLLQG